MRRTTKEVSSALGSLLSAAASVGGSFRTSPANSPKTSSSKNAEHWQEGGKSNGGSSSISSEGSVPCPEAPNSPPADMPTPARVLLMEDHTLFDVEFWQKDIGIDLETDFYGEHTIVSGFRRGVDGAVLAAEKTKHIKAGQYLVGINGVSILSLTFKQTIAKIKKTALPRTLRFWDASNMSIHEVKEQLQVQKTIPADGRDVYGFLRSNGYLQKEQSIRIAKQALVHKRDMEWSTFLKGVGGLKGLEQFQSGRLGSGRVGSGHARSEKTQLEQTFLELLKRGIPVAFRGAVWQELAGVRARRRQFPTNYYTQLLTRESLAAEDIAKDIDRTFPGHDFFESIDGQESLRRCLLAFSVHNPTVGYCQSMNFIAGMLLLFMAEEDAFWMLLITVEDLLPVDYYTKSMIGTHVDQHVFLQLISTKAPVVHQILADSSVHLSLISLQWFLCVFLNTLPLETALRIWDVFFFDGDEVIFRAGVALLKINEPNLVKSSEISKSDECADPFGEVFTCLKEIGENAVDADELIQLAYDEGGSSSKKSFSPVSSSKNRRQGSIDWNGLSKTGTAPIADVSRCTFNRPW
jgi:hypothetical protein